MTEEMPAAEVPPQTPASGLTAPQSAALRRSRANRQVVGPFTLRHIAALGGTLLIAAVLLIVLTLPVVRPGTAALPTPGSSFFIIGKETVGLQLGQLAPELTGTIDGREVQLTDLDGNPITLASLRGRPVWITFWATWCPPCQQELPILRSAAETHRDQGLALVAVSVQETTVDDVRRYAQTYGLDYTIGFDATSAVFKTYQGYGLPTHLFLDRQGVIRSIHLGPVTQVDAEQILAPLLAG
ncbi:MAG: hypothetical protein QOH61_1031 [Chloroflexota bacterium]|jgi:thiol-disulfide isomerase/thioredoxin|nr:hypothetical protein [Chloroflexota bacterium]